MITDTFSRLVEPPASVSPRHRRGYFVMLFGNAVGLTNHAAFLLIFAVYSVTSLMVFNLFSVALFAFNLVIQKRYGRTLTAMSLAALEVIIHQIFAVYILGWDYGFQYYLIVVPAFIYLGHFERHRVPLSIAALSIVSLAWLWLQGQHLGVPHDAMPFEPQYALYTLNLLSTAALVALFAVIFNQATRHNESALIEANVQAQRASKVKSEFLANMSHELRTPLNAIIGYSEMLQEDAEREEEVADLNKIVTAGHHLLGLVNDILDISKIEAEKLEIVSVPFEPHEMFNTIQNLFEPMVADKDIDLRFDIGPELPTELAGDVMRLRQVVTNLMSNALKFTERGSVTLTARVLDATDEAHVTLVVTVRDTGIGITPEQLERIFEPFTQADQSVQRKFGGTGLGLSISKKLVQLMGGTFEAESEVGSGSCFTLKVPFSR